MPTALYVTMVLAGWIGAGLAAVVFLGRRGHRSPSWYVIGAALGPLFVPIAAERARRDTRRLDVTSGASGYAGAAGRVTVVVGFDGSPESENVLDEVQRVFATERPQVVLVSVVDQDAEFDGGSRIDGAREDLIRRADQLASRLPRPATEVVAGPPAEALMKIAEARDADLIAVGRRGRGLSRRVLGGVADQVVREAPRSVLLGCPRPDRG